MAGVYIISIRWAKSPNTKAIESALAPIGEWLRFSSDIWLLKTSRNSQDIFTAISGVLSKEDQELITRMVPDDYNGWAATWINEWLAKNVR